MKLRYRFLLMAAAFSASKHSIAGSIATGAAAIAIGPAFGVDPILWGIAAAGAVIGKFKNPATTRTDTAINGVISVMAGGLGAPIAMYVINEIGYRPPYQAELLAALLFAITWPFIVKQIPDLVSRVKDKFLPKDAK
jgi:hypothetical protein